MKKNLRKNNGFAGIDISISMIIILIFIPTIFGIVYNIGKINSNIKRKSSAVSLATEVLEVVKSEKYDDVVTTNGKLCNDLKAKYAESDYKNEEKEEAGYSYKYFMSVGENSEHYQIQVGIKNYYPNDTENLDLVKQVKVRVFYSIGSEIKNIDIGMEVKNI